MCISERLVCSVFIWVFKEARPSGTVEIMAVVCSSRTENNSSSVFREDVLVALEVVTILWMRSSSVSTRVKSWVRLEVADVASEACCCVWFFVEG